MASTLGVDNPFRYRGYYYDTETGLYYLESRYYNPELGRMMSADSLSVLGMSKTTLNDKNLYNYCDGIGFCTTDSCIGVKWKHYIRSSRRWNI